MQKPIFGPGGNALSFGAFRAAQRKPRRRNQHDGYMNQFAGTFVPGLGTLGEPVDCLSVGAGTGELDKRTVAALIDDGVPLQTVVLVEPDGDHFKRLEAAVIEMRERFPRVTFITVQNTAEGFLADSQWLRWRFAIIISSQVYYYLDDPQASYCELQRRLTPNGQQIISLQMPNVGMNGLHAELVADLGYPVFSAAMHIDKIVHYARLNGDPHRLAVEWADFDATPIADQTDEGNWLLSFMLYQDVTGIEDEMLPEFRRRALLRTYLDPADGVTRVFSQPVGVLTTYGPQCSALTNRRGLWLPDMA